LTEDELGLSYGSCSARIAILFAYDVTFASLDYDVRWDNGGDADNWQQIRTGMGVVRFYARFPPPAAGWRRDPLGKPPRR
jgi:hypothetical protein